MLEARGRGPQAIILAPTRELVQQIVVELQKLAAGGPVVDLRHVRRRADRAADPGAAEGRRPRRRHARPRARPHRAPHAVPRAISSTSSSTRPTGCSTSGSAPTSSGSSASCPSRGRRCCSRPPSTPTSGSWPSAYMFEPIEVNLSRDEPSVETIQQFCISVEHDRKYRPAGPPAQARPAAAVHRLHPHQARGRPAGRPAAAG